MLFIIPIALSDRRKWHWYPDTQQANALAKLIAISAFFAIRLQVSIIYFSAAVAKFSNAEWLDGTAIYYWFLDPYMGAADWLRSLLLPILRLDSLVLMSWSVLFLELVLSAALFMPKQVWGLLLLPGIIFHVLIGFVFGIQSFAVIMIAALILYLRPTEKAFEFTVLWRSSKWRTKKFSQ